MLLILSIDLPDRNISKKTLIHVATEVTKDKFEAKKLRATLEIKAWANSSGQRSIQRPKTWVIYGKIIFRSVNVKYIN